MSIFYLEGGFLPSPGRDGPQATQTYSGTGWKALLWGLFIKLKYFVVF